jgi:hypothetical protein
MAKKREVTEESTFKIGISTIIIGCLYLLLVQLFFFLLASQTQAVEYDANTIVFGLVVATVITAFLGWIHYMLSINRHLALVIGLMGIGIVIYSIFGRFKGPYTITFISVGAIVAFAYIIYHYSKSEKEA